MEAALKAEINVTTIRGGEQLYIKQPRKPILEKPNNNNTQAETERPLVRFIHMSGPIHFIVSRSRHGWAVNVDADLLSEHERLETARHEAAQLTEEARRDGQPASLVDLSGDRTD